jgi:hypothetical protein
MHATCSPTSLYFTRKDHFTLLIKHGPSRINISVYQHYLNEFPTVAAMVYTIVPIGTKRYVSYWKLEDYNKFTKEALKEKLGSAGYDFNKTSTRALLIIHAKRVDKGMLCYRHCTIDELKKSVTSRHLVLTSTSTISKSSLESLLITADNEPKISASDMGFLNLPPEVRNKIYGYYLSSFGKEPTTLVPPPLARANRQVRIESSGMFYAKCIFKITYHFDRNWGHLWPDLETAGLLQSLKKKNAPTLHKLRFGIRYVGDYYCSRRNATPLGSFTVEVGKHLSRNGRKFEIEFDDEAASKAAHECVQLLKLKLQEILEHLTVDEGKDALGLSEIESIKRAILEACKDIRP